MARIGDEVGAHALDHDLVGLLAERQEGTPAAVVEEDGLDAGRELLAAVPDRAEGGGAGLARTQRGADRRQHARVAERAAERDAGALEAECPVGGRVGARHQEIAVDQEKGVGQRLDQRLEQAAEIAAPLPLRLELAPELGATAADGRPRPR